MSKLYRLFMLCLVLTATQLHAQVPDFMWVKQTNGASLDITESGRAITQDASGNIYVTGDFNGTITFGSTTLTSEATDVFVAKYNSSGNVLWARKAGGSDYDYGYGAATDADGNVYITGDFNGTMSLGSVTLTSAGGHDVFVAKYDASGNVLWAKSAGGAANDHGYSIAVDAVGNAFVTGSFSGTSTFGTTTLTSVGGLDIFVTKFDASGNMLWAQGAGSAGNDHGYGIAVDASGNAYTTGDFSGTINLGSTTLEAQGGKDILLAKFDTAGNILWAKSAGGSYDDHGYDIAVDASGNAFVTGSFLGTATFGSTALTTSGGYDVFVAKLDASGNILWARKAGGSNGADYGNSIAIDASGNTYVTGNFRGLASFGSILLSSDGDYDIFVAKYDASGTILWAKKAGGYSGSDYAYSIYADASGNAFITGSFRGQATFGSLTHISTGNYDVFLAKYDASGNVPWARKVAGTHVVYAGTGYSISVDASGNSYIAGSFQGTVTFGTITLTSLGYYDMFLAKYDASGNVLWATKAGGTSLDDASDITVDAAGNAYVTGSFSGTATFGSTTLTSSGSNDMFVAKLDAAGNILWARKAGSKGSDQGSGISVDGSGNIYVAGSYAGLANSISEGTISFGNTTLTNSGNYDAFVAKYDASGNLLWARKAAGSGLDTSTGIAVDASGNAYITGGFSGTSTFGAIIHTSSGSRDVFLAKYDAAGNVLWVKTAGGSDLDVGSDITLDAAGNIYMTGYFAGTATFGSTTFTSGGQGSRDMFVTKYDAFGNLLWVQRGGGIGGDTGNSISVDASGNTYITGRFEYTATFGSTTLTSAGEYDAYVVKLDAAGNILWARSAGGTGYDYGFGIFVDGLGDAYVTGSFSYTANFGSITLSSAGGSDVFFTKLNSGGKVTGIVNAGLVENLFIHPNPTCGKLQVSLPLAAGVVQEVRLLDMKGQTVLRKNFTGLAGEFNEAIDLSDQARGVYLLQVVTNRGVMTKRVVKQ